MQKKTKQVLPDNEQNLDPHQTAANLLSALIIEVEKNYSDFIGDMPINTTDAYVLIKQSSDLIKSLLLWMVAHQLVELKDRYKADLENGVKKRIPKPSRKERVTERVCRGLQKLILKDKWMMTERDFGRLVQFYINHFFLTQWNDITPVDCLIEKGKQILKNKPASPIMRQAFNSLKTPGEGYMLAAFSKRNQKITQLLEPAADLPFDTQDVLGRYLSGVYQSFSPSQQMHWKTYWASCLKEGTKNCTEENWLRQVTASIENISIPVLQQTLLEALTICKNRLFEIHASPDYFFVYLNKPNLRIFKAMLWSCPVEGHPHYLKELEAYILMALKKKPGLGPVSLTSAAAGIRAISRLPLWDRKFRLALMEEQIKDPDIVKMLAKHLATKGTKPDTHAYNRQEGVL